MWQAIAFAQNGAQKGAPAGSFFDFLIPIFIIFLVFYFIVIRPQQKKMKEHKSFLDSLKSGDEVLTNSGIYGKVINISDNTVTIEIANNVRVKMEKSSISAGTKAQKKESQN